MGLHIAIFEDDKDLADHFKDFLESLDYEVSIFYSLKKIDWSSIDVIFADYRNKLIPFEDAVQEAKKQAVPLIAISGGEMKFNPSLKKPFTVEEMQAAIMQAMSQKENDKEESIFSLFRTKTG